MNRYWSNIVEPILNYRSAKSIIEIGVAGGHNTKNLIEYCSKKSSKYIGIDPFPLINIDDLKNKHDFITFYKDISLNALPQIDEFDVLLIDGDHNWYTVFNELKIIESKVKNTNQFPLIFLHDISWPYGRRDMYYNPDIIPRGYRKPYAKLGIEKGKSRLKDSPKNRSNSINRHLNNALYEGGTQNGVLTAIEDFLKSTTMPVGFEKIDLFHGLGVLFPKNSKNELQSFIQQRLRYAEKVNRKNI
ncbi:class I SAM-dependent methyltransferase [Sutcliffiella horikoshii]|uniref:class I SAM-dependent methyltransferase n=1 Tax=Sutcliffiella horikoshii TaxID=79883 RepID=UPI00203DAFA7|nr:class I SAM-dependent methyltransferase [Sutcliffiella horikoshii]MCM3616821.1 class I SAM-dependent methyltransferase [Sutcliffiella horikoshii]